MRCLLIQPPFTQLNAPYPAIWYLDRFLRERGHDSHALDGSINCVEAIYSSSGLGAIFEHARFTKPTVRNKAEQKRLQAFFDQEPLYCSLIEPLLAFLQGNDPAFAYKLAVGAGVPSGMRTEQVIGDQGGISVEEAPALATAILNDLGDFIRVAVDPDFGTIRYAERLPSSVSDFGHVLRKAKNSWLLERFYTPWLERQFRNRDTKQAERLLVGISIPFPGCLVAAVLTALKAREVWGDTCTIVLGGGYVSTELRDTEDPELFDVFDHLVYDGGFGNLAGLLAALESGQKPQQKLVDIPDPYRELEDIALAAVHPDYHGAEFRKYLRIVDSPNPMHRLWNEIPWLKYRLAYGCYWKRCAFCDTQLHYINHYAQGALDGLLRAMDAAAASHGLHGIHFVDEAMPPKLVRAFADQNRQRKRPFTFWGNVRFDRAWTAELCEQAALGGLVAVSGGIEIATAEGLEIVDKGFTLAELLRCLVNFKQAGILVHAYLIYGFPGQTDQGIADSAEMVRVLLAEGLIDSAFWHHFVLTRYSRLHHEIQQGLHPGIQPIYPKSRFAANDLGFQGEDYYSPWTQVLDQALQVWAHQRDTAVPLTAFYGRNQARKLPAPKIKALQLLREAGVTAS